MTPVARKKIAAALAAAAALFLLQLEVNREFINLTPTPGLPFTETLSVEKSYAQSFTTSRTSINSVGLYLRPIVQNIPDETLGISLSKGETLISNQVIPAVFLQEDAAVNIAVDPPVQTQPGDRITIRLQVPRGLSGKIGLQLREYDESFAGANAQFTIDGHPQTHPAAYQVLYKIHPPLAIQLAGLLLLLTVYLLLYPLSFARRNAFSIAVAVTFAILASVPAILLGTIPLTLMFTQAAVFLLSFFLLRKMFTSPPAIFTSASIIAFTSWWSLHLVANTSPFIAQPLKDILLDPNQISISHQAGSYIGFFAAGLAILGFLTVTAQQIKRSNFSRGTSKLLLAAALLGIILTYTASPHFITITTIALACFAGHGLEALTAYLGRTKITRFIAWTLAIIILLDLWHITANTLEYHILGL